MWGFIWSRGYLRWHLKPKPAYILIHHFLEAQYLASKMLMKATIGVRIRVVALNEQAGMLAQFHS